jgi:hypothetical protein
MTDEQILKVVDDVFGHGHYEVSNPDWIRFARALLAASATNPSGKQEAAKYLVIAMDDDQRGHPTFCADENRQGSEQMTDEEARDLIAEHLDYGGSLDSHALAVAISASGVALESRVLADREPVAWLYTMHMEGDQTNAKVTLNEENPFGEPDRDYSAVYPVIKEPLFAHPTPDDASQRPLAEEHHLLSVVHRIAAALLLP